MLRWISGVVIAIIVVLLLFFAPEVGVQGTVVVLSMLGLWEYFNLTQQGVSALTRGLGILIGGGSTFLLIFWAHTPDHFLTIFASILILTFLIHFKGSADFEERFRKMVFFYFGIMYTSLLFSYWGWMRSLPQWHFWVFIMLGSTVAADVGGYVVGKNFGKHRLAPLLSPGKTLEGLIGGFIFATGAAFIVRTLFRPDFPVLHLLSVSSAISLLGPVGDLSESLIKRGVHVKDSGNLIPGHGGLLDRVDALLFTGPLVYFLAKFYS